ncbi:MAG TPA: hypothetical protein VLH79_03340 [Chthonomonadales bacterium]|nr:hypothetical protein [Chthonomonadales bacterium]
MYRSSLSFAAVFVALAARAPVPALAQGGDRWSFAPTPDTFSDSALFDLRNLNERVAGESGFISVDARGDFRLGNGRPVRFWAVNTYVGREKPWVRRPLWGTEREPDLARHARFLAKRGVNVVRTHAAVNPPPERALTDINERDRDWIWRTVAAMKKEGIYTVISPYWCIPARIGESWGVPGGADQSLVGLLFFDETVQRGYRAWMRALLAETNPHTGIPLARDPAVAIVQLQNEDSLLFWTVNNIQGEQRTRLGRRFAEWARRKHGDLQTASRAWEGDALPGDNLAEGVLDFHNIWEMTQNRTGGRARRLDDQLQFWSETMYAFNRDMARYLREELGVRQIINAGNWRTADAGRLKDAERWSYTANEVLAVNRYFGGMHLGPNQGWAIMEGDRFTDFSALLRPHELPVNVKQVVGRPMMVTESLWVRPNSYQAEGPFLISVYKALTGVDAFFWFATGCEDWTPPRSANGYLPDSLFKWGFATPDLLGGFPAAALLYRRGYVRRGEPVVVEERSMEDIWRRRTPIIVEEGGYDPNRDAGNLPERSTVQRVLPDQTFLAGPVEVRYGGDAANSRVGDIASLVDTAAQTVRSVTGEVTLNWQQGWCLVDAPRAQGVAAHFRNRGQFSTRDLRIEGRNTHGALLVVSMDGAPLRRTRKALLQFTTNAKPTGWRASAAVIEEGGRRHDGWRLDEVGTAPWQMERADLTVTVLNPVVREAVRLDVNGMPAGNVPLERVPGGVRLRFPPDALYVVLRR